MGWYNVEKIGFLPLVPNGLGCPDFCWLVQLPLTSSAMMAKIAASTGELYVWTNELQRHRTLYVGFSLKLTY
jgi:hypothetical protein